MSYLVVFVGAGIGGAARHGMNIWVARLLGSHFPWHTLVINILGSIVMGLITGWFAEFGHLEGPPGGVQYRTDGGRFWGATFDVSALYRLNAVRRMLDEQGLTTAEIAAHARGLQARFQAAVLAGEAGPLSQAEILNPVEGDAPRARFLALRSDEAARWKADLQHMNVVTDVRDDVIRFGFGLYQDRADVERLIAVCAETLG